MSFDNSFYSVDHSEYTPTRLRKAGRGLLRLALLFGSAGLALALIIVPLLNQQATRSLQESVFPEGIDRTTTASVKRAATPVAEKKIEVAAPANAGSIATDAPKLHDICIIEPNGHRDGDC